MFVYSDLRTDARVIRAVNALKEDYNVTLLATNSDTTGKNIPEGVQYIDVIDSNITNPLKRYIRFLYKVRKIIKETNPDYIYGHDYYSAPIIGYRIGIPHKCNLIYDAHELYVANKNSSLREKIVFHIEKKAITLSDLVICASDRRKGLMKEIYHTKNDIVSIPNISILPRDEKSQYETNANLCRFWDDKRIKVVYCGALIKARRVDKLIDAISSMKSDFELLIIGNGEERKKLELKLSECKPDNVLMLDSVPYRCMYSLLYKCDIGFLYYENDSMNNTNCAPNKIYEYASAGLVMLANNNPGLKDIFDTFQIGVAQDDLELGLETIKNNYATYKKNIGSFLAANSWEEQAKKLREAIASLA